MSQLRIRGLFKNYGDWCYRVKTILSINEMLPLTRVHLTKEHIWIFLHTELPFFSAFIFVVYSPMHRYYRKRCSAHLNARYPFSNEHEMFPLSSLGICQVVVVPESQSLACSIWWNDRNHFDGVFKEYLSGIHWHICFWNNVFTFW